MKILLLSIMYPSARFPSFGVFVKNWEESLLTNGIAVERVVISSRNSGIRRIGTYLGYAFHAARAALRGDIDLIYVHFVTLSLLPLVLVAPFVRAPLVLNVHGTDIMSDHWLSKLILRCNIRLIKKSKLIVVPSEYMREHVHRRFGGSDVFVSASSGVDGKYFSPEESPIPGNDVIRIGYVSRLIESKGWREFLLAVRMLQDRHLNTKIAADVVGGGPDSREFLRLRSALGLNGTVNFLGELDQKELAACYRRLSLFVFPSRLPESLGLVGLEAMACGIPVIASSVGAVPSVVKHGVNGFLFAPGHAEAIVSHIEAYLAMDEQTKRAMRESCLKTAHMYNREVVVRSLINKLESVSQSQHLAHRSRYQ